MMGDPDPDEFPEIIVGKWYKVTAESFQGPFAPPSSCTDDKVAEGTCCATGLDLNEFFVTGPGCKNGLEICPVSGFSSQRVLAIEGPFDTFNLCQAAL